jgi:hypothetical protein
MAKTLKRDVRVEQEEEGKVTKTSEKGGSTESSKNKEASYKGLQDVVFESDKQRSDFLKQMKSEYEFATRELKTWVDINLRRLKLYNNQKRNEKHIGEPLLFTHTNSWIASMYDDTFDRVWVAREAGDVETAENMTAVAEYDYELMEKDQLQYDEIFDFLFFSYSITDQLEFNPRLKCPMAHLIDPLVFYYDTFGNSIEKMRFLGWDMYMSELEIKTSPMLGQEVLEKLKKMDSGGMSHKDEARKERLEAMGGTYSHFKRDDMQDNNLHELIQWRSILDGKKVVALLAPKCGEILGCKYLPQDKNGNSMSWFVSSKRFNPSPHSFKGTSLPDLLEDKQRQKAMIINDQINLARSLVYGSYLYDQNKVTNKYDLKWGYDKWVGVDGDPTNAVMAMRKDTNSLAFLDNTLGYIDMSAQKASATPELQQGVLSEQQRTLGELNLIATSSKNRYSLALKTFAVGERDFWGLYYLQYKIHFSEGLGKKIVRIGGSGRVFREFTKDNIICKVDPDIRIESRAVNEAREQGRFRLLIGMADLVMQDPTADKRAWTKDMMGMAGVNKQQIDNWFPRTSDEILAYEQNEQINKDEMPEFLVNDNHLVHIRIHREAKECKTKQDHIITHMKALKIEQENPMANQDAMQQGMQPDEQGGQLPQDGSNTAQQQQGNMTPSAEAGILNKMSMM